jgi:hypothetical protein
MKNLLILLFFYAGTVFAQEASLKPTHQFTISGQIKKESVITMDSLNSYPLKGIGEIKVTNHLGDFKHKDDKLKGVLLKDILSHSVLNANSPKLYSRFYFNCVGSDGYSVVYSWNELFNTPVGEQVYILLEKNGVKATQMPESLQMTSMLDFKTGRRFLHNLDKIIVSQVP